MCGVALLALHAAPAAAQDKPAASGVAVEELVVTGSRIPQPNVTSISPIQTVDSKQVQLGGRAATIDILNQLPQVTQNAAVDLGPTSNPLSGPGGVATVDLRGLGPQRTLVLVNGRRLGVGDPNTGNPNPAPDINQIPSQLIDRIEVLTGGASATYGSDAVAGVVNFIMKKNFEGVQIDYQTGLYQHGNHNSTAQGILRGASGALGGAVPVPGGEWDGRSYDTSIVFGANAPDAKGNVTGYFTYHKQDPVNFSTRDYAACQLAVSGAGVPSCTGSSNSNYFASSLGTFAGTYSVLGHNLVPRGSAVTTPPTLFNSNPYEYLIQDSTRYTAGFDANYQINKHFELYSEFGFMNDRTNVNIAPSGLFGGQGASSAGGYLVNCNNPFLSAQEQGVIGCTPTMIASGGTVDMALRRRNVEGGPRNQYYEHNNYRFVFGSRGDIVGPWKYDMYASYYYTTFFTRISNYLSVAKVQDALLVGGTAANPVCLSGHSGCVPYNIFADNGVTAAQASSLQESGTARGSFEERIVEATVTGDLSEYGVKSPWASSGVGVAFGATQRRDHLDFQPDQAEESNDLSGGSGAAVTVNKSLRAAELYGEVRAPIVTDMTFAKELLLEAGYRYSDYSTGIQAKTYKVGFQYAPVDDIRFRGSYNKAIRAPNILELYTPFAVTQTSVVSEDPCAQGALHPATLAQCLNTHIAPAQYGKIQQCPAGQCAILQGGNPNLKPEEAKTFTIGALMRPRWTPGLTFSIDYFRIKQTDQIGAISIDITLNRCLQTGQAQFCDLVVRNPVTGILFGTSPGQGYVNGANVNVGAVTLSGLDFQGSYRLPMADWGIEKWGGLTFDFNGTYTLSNKTVPLPGDPAYDCAGLFGPACNNSVNPKWRHTLRLTWTTPWNGLSLSGNWRYIGGSKFISDTLEPNVGQGTFSPFNHTIAAVSYFDLAGIWRVNDTFTLRGGVNNIFDKDPPMIASSIVGTGLPNTYPNYDLLGRKLFVGVTASF
jgi:outer membrane receptor protein involved in Fe transport